MNYPALRLDVDRVHAGELGLTQKDVVDNVITALNSNFMIAPNYWVDRKSGNDYYLTVQYFEKGRPRSTTWLIWGRFRCGIRVMVRVELRPVGHRTLGQRQPSWTLCRRERPTTVLNNVVSVKQVQTPTEVDHYQIQRVIDIYVTPAGKIWERVTERGSQDSR